MSKGLTFVVLGVIVMFGGPIVLNAMHTDAKVQPVAEMVQEDQ